MLYKRMRYRACTVKHRYVREIGRARTFQRACMNRGTCRQHAAESTQPTARSRHHAPNEMRLRDAQRATRTHQSRTTRIPRTQAAHSAHTHAIAVRAPNTHGFGCRTRVRRRIRICGRTSTSAASPKHTHFVKEVPPETRTHADTRKTREHAHTRAHPCTAPHARAHTRTEPIRAQTHARRYSAIAYPCMR